MRHRLPLYDVFRDRLGLYNGLSAASDRSARPGRTHAIRVFDDGKSAFAEILRRVHEAQKSIEVRAFLWRDDEVGNRLGQAILDAAERGVEITIQKDRIAAVYEYLGGNKQSFFHKRINPTQRFQAWFLGAVYRSPGSFRQKPNPLAEAILCHPKITVHHERKRFDHSKVFVFDERVITLGSMGIGDNHHSEWVDIMVEIDGSEHVERLRQRLAGNVPFDPGLDVDFLVHSRGAAPRRDCSMLAQRLALIEAAERTLTIEMAYLGDPRFTNVLLRAIKRGVEVTLVTAAQADVLGNLNRATCDKLLRRTGAPKNLTIAFLPRMVHSKIVVVDGSICDVGSANFTPLSHGVYDEINLYGVDRNLARDLEDVVDGHCEEGEVVEGRIGYRRLHSHVERAIVAYQSRRGGRLRRPRRTARRPRRKPLRLLPPPMRAGRDTSGPVPVLTADTGAESPTDGAERRADKRARKLARKRARRLARARKAAEKNGLLIWRGRKGTNRARTRP
ncbi:MAG: phosphatidylserine/phosphatidylglycerophosphate/cardiolipin synthase family protein [Proteobacteria bacterium]|nr:phosphatidylserine/phosphatidylglycerophosphate/cardiolipin synthase family protein [Pseudomonadota bacterium]